ncbi:MAG: cytochrome P450 [Pseudomonadota bacterium]
MRVISENETDNVIEWLTEKHLQLVIQQKQKPQQHVVELPSNKKKVVAICGIETINEVLVEQADSLKRPKFKAFNHQNKIIQHIIETQNNEKFKLHRSGMEKVLREQVTSRAAFVESWLQEEIHKQVNVFSNIQKPFDPGPDIALTNLKFLYRLAFGRNLSPEEIAFFNPKAVDVLPLGVFDMVKLDDIIDDELRSVFLSSKKDLLNIFGEAVDGLEGFVAHNVAEQKKSFDAQHSRGVFDALLHTHKQLKNTAEQAVELSEYEILNGSLFQFIGAGVGLTTFFMRFALHYMIIHENIQNKIQQELDQAINHGAKTVFSDRKNFPFTEATIWEILRHTSMTNFAPLHYEATTDVRAGDVIIEKGTLIIANYYSLTRDKRYWHNPETFDPERFLNDEHQIRRDLVNKFYPFGIGPRRCVGEHLGRTQIFTFFATLMSQCQFRKSSSTPEVLDKNSGVFLIPHDYELVVNYRK